MAVSTGSAWSSGSALSVLVQDAIIDFSLKLPVAANLFRVVDVAEGIVTRRLRWPTLSAGAITEGTDMTPTTVTPSSASITVATVGIAMEITDLLDSAKSFAGLQPFIEQAGGTLVEKLEDDLAALFGALNGGTSIGTSGSDATLANMLDAVVALKAAQVPMPYFFILHPQQWRDYWASIGATGTGGSFVNTGMTKIDQWADGSMGVGYVTNIAGIPAYESARCPLVNTSADRGGVLANPDAITVARKWSVKVEADRNIYGPSTKLAATSAYGVAETVDTFGVPVETDA